MKTPIITIALFLSTVAIYAESSDLPAFAVSGADITEARVDIKKSGDTTLHLKLTMEKKVEWGKFTEANVHKQVRIVVDGAVASEPIIVDAIKNGEIAISVASPDDGLKRAKELLNYHK
jgi:preprotein translocase subunit SecD